MKITILTDNKKSWFIPYGVKLNKELNNQGYDSKYVYDKNDIRKGDICYLLSCSRIIENIYLKRNKNNIVVHASDLPKGKGFSPLQWQILDGKNEITLSLFEVVEKVDAGPIYFKNIIKYEGTELLDKLRDKMGFEIIKMCLYFAVNLQILSPKPQKGTDSFYRKRKKKDDEINPHLSISNQFNHFRIADNENYPLWFKYKNKKYILKIYEENDD